MIPIFQMNYLISILQTIFKERTIVRKEKLLAKSKCIFYFLTYWLDITLAFNSATAV